MGPSSPSVSGTRRRTPRYRLHAAPLVLLAVLVAALTAASVFGRGPPRTESFVSLFGMDGPSSSIRTNGVFVYHGARLEAERVGADLVVLVLVVPAMLWSAFAWANGSLRARLAALGLVGVVLHLQFTNWAHWSTDGGLALLSAVVILLCAPGLAQLAWDVSLEEVARAAEPEFPYRAAVRWSVLVAAISGGLWLFGWSVASDGPSISSTDVRGVWLLAVLAAIAAATLARRRPIGVALVASLAVAATALSATRFAMAASAVVVGEPVRPGPLVVSVIVLVGSLHLVSRIHHALGR